MKPWQCLDSADANVAVPDARVYSVVASFGHSPEEFFCRRCSGKLAATSRCQQIGRVGSVSNVAILREWAELTGQQGQVQVQVYDQWVQFGCKVRGISPVSQVVRQTQKLSALQAQKQLVSGTECKYFP